MLYFEGNIFLPSFFMSKTTTKQSKNNNNKSDDNNIALSLLWDMLPPELESLFTIESYEKTPKAYRIRLTEKNIIPNNLPEKYHWKKVINSYTREITMDDFPIRWKKSEIILNRRAWKFEDIPEIYHRDLEVFAPWTKLNKEFGAFLKVVSWQWPLTDKYYSQV